MSLADETQKRPRFFADLPPVLAAWLPVLGIVAATMVLTIALHWTAVATAVELWATRSAYNHGFLILPISFYLIWDRRHHLAALTPEPMAWAATGLFSLSLVWLFARSAGLMEGEHFVIVALFQAIVITLLGVRFYWAMLLPMNYLWLLVPTGTLFYPVLQSIALKLTVFMLKLMGIATYAEGYQILVPTGTYFIAAGCAGLNFILATLALAPLYTTFIYSSMRKRIIAVAIALFVSVVANAARIAAIIAIAQFTNRRIDIVDDHLLYGWGLFVVILALLGWIGLRFADPDADAAPDKDATISVPTINWKPVILAAAAAWVALIAIPAYNAIARGDVSQSFALALGLPSEFERVPDAAYPKYPKADFLATWVDKSNGAEISLVLFSHQTEDRSSFSPDNFDYEPNYWSLVSKGHLALNHHGEQIPLRLMRLARVSEHRLVATTHWVGGEFTTRKIEASLLQAKADLSFSDRRSTVLIVSFPVTNDAWDQSETALAAWFEKSSILDYIVSKKIFDPSINNLEGN
jgi:exosortase A